MSWNVIVSDDPNVKARWSNDVVISAAEDAEVNQLVAIITKHLDGIRGTLTLFDSVNANILRARGYNPGPRAWQLYFIAASRIDDAEFKVGTHSYDSLSTAADDQYFVISKKTPAQRAARAH